MLAREDVPIGYISLEEHTDDYTIAFRIYGIELTYEHLCVSFMDYMGQLNELIESHKYHYAQLKEQEQSTNDQSQIGDLDFHQPIANA